MADFEITGYDTTEAQPGVQTFWDVMREVSEFLGLSAEPGGEEFARVRSIVEAGWRRYLTPYDEDGDPYYWSWLMPLTRLMLSSGDQGVNLPTDFRGMVGDAMTYEGEPDKIEQRPELQVRRILRNSYEGSGKPQVFAVRALSTGQYELVFAPVPDSSYSVEFRYLRWPDQIYYERASGSATIGHTRWEIKEADDTNDFVSVADDRTDIVGAGDLIRIAESEGNDGRYEVSSVSYDSDLDRTDLYTVESLPSGVASGRVVLFGTAVMIDSDTDFESAGVRAGDRVLQASNAYTPDRHREVTSVNAHTMHVTGEAPTRSVVGYRVAPEGLYLHGCPEYYEALRELALAEAESQSDDTMGLHAKQAQQQLLQAVKADRRKTSSPRLSKMRSQYEDEGLPGNVREQVDIDINYKGEDL